jgi:hypothetical protein
MIDQCSLQWYAPLKLKFSAGFCMVDFRGLGWVPLGLDLERVLL